MRKIKFQNHYYYHIYNRGVDKRDVFLCFQDYTRFIKSTREFNTTEQIGSLYKLSKHNQPLSGSKSHLEATRLIEILCYCLIPNHYHFLLKQKQENGIPKFLHKLSMGYTHYFNNKYNRTGSLFQGTYKAIEIKNEHKLIRTSCYINGNPEIHKISKAKNWQWSSYKDYLGLRNGTLCNKNIILNQFRDMDEYKGLANNIIKDNKELKNEIKFS